MNNNPQFTDPQVQKCPFSAYEQIRAKGPVYFEESTGYYHVLDYEHVQVLAADKLRLSNNARVMNFKGGMDETAINAVIEEHGLPIVPVLVEGDDPDHSFHRALVNNAFFPGRVRKIENFIEGLTTEYIDSFIDRGEVDFFAQFAIKLPMSIIADQLGVPKADLPLFQQWSDSRVARSEPGLSIERILELTREGCKLQMYIDQRAKEYELSPGDCILSNLVHADMNGRKLSREEINAIAAVLIVAGNETTTTALCHCMFRIATDTDLQHSLRDDATLLAPFIEEVLRLDAPIQSLFRRTLVDIDVGGFTIPADSVVVLKWGAANRDEQKFPEPDKLDLERKNMRQHLTFGYGPHSCIGNQLARSEMRIALNALLKRANNWRLARGEESYTRQSHYFLYGFKKLELAFDKA